MNINTDYLDRCIATLERAFDLLQDYRPGEIEYDLYRSACVKEAVSRTIKQSAS